MFKTFTTIMVTLTSLLSMGVVTFAKESAIRFGYSEVNSTNASSIILKLNNEYFRTQANYLDSNVNEIEFKVTDNPVNVEMIDEFFKSNPFYYDDENLYFTDHPEFEECGLRGEQISNSFNYIIRKSSALEAFKESLNDDLVPCASLSRKYILAQNEQKEYFCVYSGNISSDYNNEKYGFIADKITGLDIEGICSVVVVNDVSLNNGLAKKLYELYNFDVATEQGSYLHLLCTTEGGKVYDVHLVLEKEFDRYKYSSEFDKYTYLYVKPKVIGQTLLCEDVLDIAYYDIRNSNEKNSYERGGIGILKKNGNISLYKFDKIFYSDSDKVYIYKIQGKRDLIANYSGLISEDSEEKKADKTIKVFINKEELSLSQNPVLINGTTLIPMRQVFEALNAEVKWDENTKTVESTKGNITIKMTIGEESAYVNDNKIKLIVPAKIIDGHTFIPLRFVSESLGYYVYWDGTTKTINIETNK